MRLLLAWPLFVVGLVLARANGDPLLLGFRAYQGDRTPGKQSKLPLRKLAPDSFVAFLVITVSILPVFALEGQAGRIP